MASAHDVAAYMLSKKGEVSAMKLQKLLYYAQAWSLVWDERPMFSDKIRAWANGPVIPTVYNLHRGRFMVNDWPEGKAEILTKDERETVDAVLEFYGGKTAQWLSDLTHREDPWRNARGTAGEGTQSNTEITIAAMAEYYASIAPTDS